ncbi:MAG: iron-containing alcohol dehydrogenase [Myxococcota bacterium]
MPRATFTFPTLIEFGAGAVQSLADHVRRLGSRVLIVTDPTVRELPLFAEVGGVLDEAGIPWTVTSDVSPNPQAAECDAGGKALRESGADVVVGLGGGSSIDAAKGIALMGTHEGHIADYAVTKGGVGRIRADVPPIIAIPTTAGTGSEVGRSTVVIDPDSGSKVMIASSHLMPSVAISDAALMVGMPAWLTAATGFDALTHNLESLVARGYHPMAEGIALEGLLLCKRHLPVACQTPDDIEAREGMAMAAMMGAVAFQKDLGAAHSLAHPLGAVAGVQHGLANAIVLPYVVAYNREVARDGFAQAERLLEIDDVNAWILDLRKDLGIPHTLTEAGVSRDLLDALVDQAVDDACHATNPRPCTKDDLRRLFEAAFDGDLEVA